MDYLLILMRMDPKSLPNQVEHMVWDDERKSYNQLENSFSTPDSH
ncbi:MAG: hypothetical protein AB8G77_24275 [Rhodothermales bacterium]